MQTFADQPYHPDNLVVRVDLRPRRNNMFIDQIIPRVVNDVFVEHMGPLRNRSQLSIALPDYMLESPANFKYLDAINTLCTPYCHPLRVMEVLQTSRAGLEVGADYINNPYDIDFYNDMLEQYRVV